MIFTLQELVGLMVPIWILNQENHEFSSILKKTTITMHCLEKAANSFGIYVLNTASSNILNILL